MSDRRYRSVQNPSIGQQLDLGYYFSGKSMYVGERNILEWLLLAAKQVPDYQFTTSWPSSANQIVFTHFSKTIKDLRRFPKVSKLRFVLKSCWILLSVYILKKKRSQAVIWPAVAASAPHGSQNDGFLDDFGVPSGTPKALSVRETAIMDRHKQLQHLAT